MQMISLRQLRYFVALARHRHFGRAAEACAISQPALSLQVRELEEQLQAQLVERDHRQIRLTALGEAFAARARDILQAVDELEDLPRAYGQALAGQLRIGMIPTVAPYLLPEVMRRLAGQFPDVDLRPREAVTQKLLADLAEGTLDCAVVALPVAGPGLAAQPLFEEEFILARPLADSDRPPPDLEGLKAMRLLLLEEGHCFRDQALAFCNIRSAPKDMMEGSSLSTLVRMVGAGIGVTLIPEMAVQAETGAAAVSVTRLPAPHPTRTIGMVWRRSSPLAAHYAQVGEAARAAFAALRPRLPEPAATATA